jgi:hypothetical protein
MSILKGAAGRCLPTSRGCGCAQCGSCGGVADFACMWACVTWQPWRGCRLHVRADVRDAATVTGLPTLRACGRARHGGCGGVDDFACVWTCATRPAMVGLLTWCARRGGCGGVADSRARGHVRHGGCGGFADSVGATRWLRRGCRLRVRVDVRDAAGLLTWHVQQGGCGRVADLACMWMCATWRLWRGC